MVRACEKTLTDIQDGKQQPWWSVLERHFSHSESLHVVSKKRDDTNCFLLTVQAVTLHPRTLNSKLRSIPSHNHISTSTVLLCMLNSKFGKFRWNFTQCCLFILTITRLYGDSSKNKHCKNKH